MSSGSAPEVALKKSSSGYVVRATDFASPCSGRRGGINRYAVQGITVTLRSLFYRFVVAGKPPNKQAEYDRLGDTLLNARMRPPPGARLVLFSDAGWVGARDGWKFDPPLLSAGVGASFLDGLVRFDVSRALRTPKRWRVDLYLDAAL